MASRDPAHDVNSTARGLSIDAANRTVNEYFAGFDWTATLDPTRMTAEAFLSAVIAPRPARRS